jgi:hypothetical protein
VAQAVQERPSQHPSSSSQLDLATAMVGSPKKPTTHEASKKADSGIPGRSPAARVCQSSASCSRTRRSCARGW